jgi:AcrR family transcriptional regulator
VARTLNPSARAVRSDAILDVAERLIRTKGYEQMSVQEIQDEVGVSRGAIYHYFGSKADILEAVIERIGDQVVILLEPIAADPGLAPLEKLRRVFAVASQWKTQRKELMLALAQAWYSDPNALVRDRLREALTARIGPVIADILVEGKALGTFDVTYPEHTAEIAVGLLLNNGDSVKDLLFDRIAGKVPFERAEAYMSAYNEAFQRILGLPTGSFEAIDLPTLRFWFD